MAYDECPIPDSIRQLFGSCDRQGNGYIERDDLAVVCDDLNSEQLHSVFEALDLDGDGRISLCDFSTSFHSVDDSLSSTIQQEDVTAVQSNELPAGLSEDLRLMSCQEEVYELYQQLHLAELPHCLNQFEHIVIETIKDIKQQQEETDRLDQSLKRSNEAHAEHLQLIEQEMETQVAKAEDRVRLEEKKSANVEKDELRKNMEAEISELQANLNRFHSFEKRWQHRDKPKDEALKKRLDELQHENRQLKSSLSESQTNLVITRSELAAFKSEYDECVDSGKSMLHDYMYDHDSLARQVLQLQEANRTLHDTNDDLRSNLEAYKRHQRSRSITPTKQKRLSAATSEYCTEDAHQAANVTSTEPLSSRRRRSLLSQDSLESEASAGVSAFSKRRFVYHQTADGESYPDEVDSGNSTLRDPLELDSEVESNSMEEELRRATSIEENIIKESLSANVQQTPKALKLDSTSQSPSAFQKPTVAVAVATPTREPIAAQQSEKLQRGVSPRNSASRKRALPQIPGRGQPARPQSPPERMYKVVLAGDAAVGKSSFIMRLCKGLFQSNLNSTLGVDFQMKTLEIDGKVTSLQLWDTAGQERFRSIAKSYFRRADGVLLLYDCTYERSFINVRDWIEAIEDGAQKPIPVMICANKVDARPSAQAEGVRCVRTADGERLARSFSALFIECSAKEGSNIESAVIELTRRLHEWEDQEVNQSVMDLTKDPDKKTESKCC